MWNKGSHFEFSSSSRNLSYFRTDFSRNLLVVTRMWFCVVGMMMLLHGGVGIKEVERRSSVLQSPPWILCLEIQDRGTGDCLLEKSG